MNRLGLLLFLVACTKANPAATCPDGICVDPAHAFCDIDGMFTNQPGTCVAVSCVEGDFGGCRGDSALVCNVQGNSYDAQPCEKGCDPQVGCRPFCTPGTALSCIGDKLSTCSATGTSTIITSCALGCATGETRCLAFTPSNGLGPALLASASEADVVLPAGSRIDTDSGVIQDASGTTIPVKTELVTQVSAASIRVFEAKSFTIAGGTALGGKPLAFVADGPITVTGKLRARASAAIGGPGAVVSGTCAGVDRQQYLGGCSPPTASVGASGAGSFQSGGRGGAATADVGAAQSSFSPLTGGCVGGSQRDVSGSMVVAKGGGGGGGLQMVSATKIALIDQGLVSLGAGGGQSTAGGGSGGTLILESPDVSIVGPDAGVVANGGAGGGCNATGPDAGETAAVAPGAVCPNYFAGSGGTGMFAPGNACVSGVDSCIGTCPMIAYGGGGGSVGRLHIVTKDATYGTSGNPLFSAAITTGMLLPH